MLQPDVRLQQRYRIIRHLKQGGMGTVYEALDERLDATVALKECHFEEESLRKQFEREARLLARLRHPAMTKVIDHFTEGTGQFLVMEFISGDDLSEMLLSRKTPFPQAEVLVWADQLLDALDYLHTQEQPVIHRDIKPQNLKLTSRGQIMLLDFGLAKGYVNNISHISTTGSIFGYTPNYAPLEQIHGAGTDARSDLYSLAATAYHLLTLTPPPDALTRVTAVTNDQSDPLQLISSINPEVTLAVAEVVRHAMSQNREKRPRDASDLREMLRKAARVQLPSDVQSDVTFVDAGMPAAQSFPPFADPKDEAARLGRRELTSPPPSQDNAPKYSNVQSHDTAREQVAGVSVTAVHVPTGGIQSDPKKGREKINTPQFSFLPMTDAAPAVRWWWVALSVLVFLAFGSLFLYLIKGRASSPADNLTSTSTNYNLDVPSAGTLSTTPPISKLNAATPMTQPSVTPTPAQKLETKANANTNSDTDSRTLSTANIDDPPPTLMSRPTSEPKKIVVSGGVLNGRAISKPQPAYPPIAKAARAQGTVTVQILVDESGRVVSASAISGHPLLQQAAVMAARQARFSPILLSGQPVKVSGVITYNFMLQ